ncbi:Protein kinase-like domain containing protein [Hyaloscypha variabilis]
MVSFNHEVIPTRSRHSSRITKIEGGDLLFIKQHLEIPAPRLYVMYRDDDAKVYIVMDAVAGDTLENLWPILSFEAKSRIMKNLGSIIKELHSLLPPKLYGSITEGNIPSECGPFQNEHEFNMALARKSRSNWAYSRRHGYILDFFENNLSRALRDHPPTFTHADLQPKNIIVRQLPLNEQDLEKGHELTLVDWESVAWYPNYWEYANAVLAYFWEDDWLNMLETTITPYPAEAVMIKMVWQDLIC